MIDEATLEKWQKLADATNAETVDAEDWLEKDALFVNAAREAVPALIDEVRRLSEELAQLHKAADWLLISHTLPDDDGTTSITTYYPPLEGDS